MLRRVFLALPATANVQNKLRALLPQKSTIGVRFSSPSNYHLTLAFVGDLEEYRCHQLAEIIDRCKPKTPIELTIDQIGPFPEKNGKILAAQIAANPPLEALHTQITSALTAGGFAIDRRETFKPHITVGRTDQARALSSLQIFCNDLLFHPTSLGIYCGEHQPKGYQYRCLFRIALPER